MFERFGALRPWRIASLLPALALLAACGSDSTGPVDPVKAEVGVVISSTERSLTVFAVNAPAGTYPTTTIGVGPEGSPVTVAARGNIAVVPLGTYPFVAVVDLQKKTVTHTVALPAGSGATGVAFLNDSIALVANSGLNSASPVNVRRGTVGAEIKVGRYPQKIVAAAGKAYVLNSGIDMSIWQPVETGSITVIDGALKVSATIALSGYNASDAALGKDGKLYVLNVGSWGANNGSLSIVDIATSKETAHHDGFGDFPGSIAVSASGKVLAGLYGKGIIEWDPATKTFTHGPEKPLTPGKIPPVAALGFDSAGRLFAVNPGECDAPGTVYRFDAAWGVAAEIKAGVCPMGIVFTTLEVGEN